MKIIFASKFYYRRGGLEAYLFKTKELLESHGHEVIPFSTDYYENDETEYSKYFCTYYNLSKDNFLKKEHFKNIKALKNMFFNEEAYDKMKKLIEDTRPDIVQGFGITKHLSYSIFKAAKDMGVTTIMRLSDYSILCPNSSATDGMGEICLDFACSKGEFSRVLNRKCIHDSVVASIFGKTEVSVNLRLNKYKKYVDYFIAPSKFIRNIFIQNMNISPQRIIYHPIFMDSESIPLSVSDDGYFLFAGRLSKEKGVGTLLKAFSKNKELRLVIAGIGPEEENLKKIAMEYGVNAEFIGFKQYDDLKEIISRCRAVIIPSEWYENSPNIVLEAFAQGKPVIGSRMGGIPELIEDKKTGLLFEMGNVEELAEKVKLINEDEDLRIRMGRNVRDLLETKFTKDEHYKNLMDIYNSATKKKVLLVNNFYYNRGGDCTYLFDLKSILIQRGHNVIVFSMHHPLNVDSLWSKYFVKYINYDEEVRNINLKSGIRVASRTIFFFAAKRMIAKLIKEEKPDIAHLQNIHHHITPSILYSLKKAGIPVVWTLHDYQLICPNISFLANGRICEKCKKRKFYWPPIVKCKKQSVLASLMSSIEITIHRIIHINKLVDRFIAPSEFVRNKFIEYGFSEDKISQLDHFTDISSHTEICESGDYYLFVGRIALEKGIRTLIDAASKVNSCKLKITGGGPLNEEMAEYARSKGNGNNIEFLGHKSREELVELYENCKFVVVPSEWYEPSGLIIFEAFAFGKPVIGADIGGIPEILKDGERGLLFEAGNSEELSFCIQRLLDNPDLVREMGINAKALIEQELSSEKHYKKVIEIYKQAISSSTHAS